MRIDRLHLIAYGPFSDAELDFSPAGAALHLVFGPNEAGKSSALRALRSLLFGIPVRTEDNFRHPHPKLRIGARLTHSDGRQIAFIRRKGQGKTLRGPDDRAVLAEDILTPFLGSADRDFFEQMFAIGHDDLVRGGEEIVAGGGRVGQALFAAGAGLIQLQGLQQKLAAHGEALFKSTGKKPRINQTLTLLKQTRRNERSARLQARTWRTHHTELSNARQRLAALDEILAAKRQQQKWLSRVATALPLIARRRELDALLSGYADLPELPEDFGARRRACETELKNAGGDLNRLQAQIESLRQQIARLEVPPEIIAQAPAVEALQHELGSFSKAQQDRPGLEARMRLLCRQAADSLADTGTAAEGAPEAHDLPVALMAEIQELGQTHARLRTRLDTAQERDRELDTEIEALDGQQQALAPPTGLEALKRALQQGIDAGPLERQGAEIDRRMAAQERDLMRDLRRQTVWNGDLAALATLPLPGRETIEHFEDRFAALSRTREKLQVEKEEQEEELARIDIEAHNLGLAGELPTEAQLETARRLREQGWRLVRRRLEGAPPDPEAEQAFAAGIAEADSLPEAFEASMRRADAIADRLRREAEQISRRDLLEARRTQAVRARRAALDDMASNLRARTDLETQWRKLWQPAQIEPDTPREMRSWLTGILSVRAKLDNLQTEKNRAEAIRAEAAALRARLIKALHSADQTTASSASLADLVAAAGRCVALHEKRQTQRETLGRENARLVQARGRLREEISQLEKEREAWRHDWSRKVARIGLAGDVSPRVAAAVMESLREARAQRSEADILAKRIQGIDRDAKAFDQRVRDLAATLAPELQDAPPGLVARQLHKRLTTARESQTARRGLEKQMAAAESELSQARTRMARATAMQQALCREARCPQPEMLPEVEQRDRQRRKLREEKVALEARLRQLSAGATVDAFVEETATVEADRITADQQQLDREIETLDQERAERNQAVGTARAELRRMDGSADAAEHAEEAERLLASLEADVAQYARLRLAATILARTIEQYRQKHQGPLIRRASRLFARMTGEAFRGVRAEFDEKGHPVLVGIRASDGEQVAVAGLSDGTADQLYLALRLASIEQYLDISEPLPFVVDDILLRFDDARSTATLKILGELAARTQVIFFTHHRHMLELARASIDAQRLGVHYL